MKEKTCKNCGQTVNNKAVICTSCGAKIKKPLLKKWWFWLIIVLVIIAISISNTNNEDSNKNNVNDITISENETADTPTDVSENKTDIKKENIQTAEEQENEKQKSTAGVNYANFQKIQNGMSYSQVVELLGEEGELLSESDVLNDPQYATKMYYWYDYTGISNCNVMFQGGKVISKAQVGLK